MLPLGLEPRINGKHGEILTYLGTSRSCGSTPIWPASAALSKGRYRQGKPRNSPTFPLKGDTSLTPHDEHSSRCNAVLRLRHQTYTSTTVFLQLPHVSTMINRYQESPQQHEFLKNRSHETWIQNRRIRLGGSQGECCGPLRTRFVAMAKKTQARACRNRDPAAVCTFMLYHSLFPCA